MSPLTTHHSPLTSRNAAAVPLDESYRYCRQLSKRAARNFYYSFLTLPGEQRRAMCALYAFARVCDDLGDDRDASDADKADSLREWRRQLDCALAGDGDQESGVRSQGSGVRGQEPEHSPLTAHHSPGHPVFPALVDVVKRYALPPAHLHAIIDGMESDLNGVRGQGSGVSSTTQHSRLTTHHSPLTLFATFEELQRYCYQVAGAVGLCCVRIWGCADERAVQPAIDCGTAFQLTNILRDLGEDAAMGRVYLPAEDLQRFDYTAEDLAAHRRDERFRDLMAFQVERARTYYRNAEALFDCLPPPGRSILAAMLGIYGGLLDEIERREYDVFSERVALSRWRKLGIALRCFVRHRVLRR